jgi:hypothetical protein
MLRFVAKYSLAFSMLPKECWQLRATWTQQEAAVEKWNKQKTLDHIGIFRMILIGA